MFSALWLLYVDTGSSAFDLTLSQRLPLQECANMPPEHAYEYTSSRAIVAERQWERYQSATPYAPRHAAERWVLMSPHCCRYAYAR